MPKKKPKDRSGNVTVKKLASLADYGSSYWQEGKAVSPTIEKSLLRRVAESSRTVDGILRRMVEDTINVERFIVPAPGYDEVSEASKKKVIEFLRSPNPDDKGMEWLEEFVYDFYLFCEAYWEMCGSADDNPKDTDKWYFGGEFQALWHVDASSMYIIANNKTGQMSTDPLDMCYEQKVNRDKVQFDARKIIHIARFRKGRLYAKSPLVSLLNIIAGQINLTGYLTGLYDGEIPQQILNAGDMDDKKMDRLIALMQEQIENAQNPYGIIAVNVPKGFQLEKIMDSAESGKFIEALLYFREEICGVFGMPPSKMGWATPGKLGSQTDMDDTYYDVVERGQDKIEKALYFGTLASEDGLNTPDAYIKFGRVRPKQVKIEAEANAKNARAIQVNRQEQIMSVNEVRIKFLNLPKIDEDWARDPQLISPVLSNRGGTETEPEEEKEEEKGAENIILRSTVPKDWPYDNEKNKKKS